MSDIYMATKIQRCLLRQPHFDNMSLCRWKHNASAHNLSMSRPELFSNLDFAEIWLHWKLGNSTCHNGIKISPQTWLSLGFLFRRSSALNTNHCAATAPLSMRGTTAGHSHHCSSGTHHVTYNAEITGSRGKAAVRKSFRNHSLPLQFL